MHGDAWVLRRGMRWQRPAALGPSPSVPNPNRLRTPAGTPRRRWTTRGTTTSRTSRWGGARHWGMRCLGPSPPVCTCVPAGGCDGRLRIPPMPLLPLPPAAAVSGGGGRHGGAAAAPAVGAGACGARALQVRACTGRRCPLGAHATRSCCRPGALHPHKRLAPPGALHAGHPSVMTTCPSLPLCRVSCVCACVQHRGDRRPLHARGVWGPLARAGALCAGAPAARGACACAGTQQRALACTAQPLAARACTYPRGCRACLAAAAPAAAGPAATMRCLQTKARF